MRLGLIFQLVKSETSKLTLQATGAGGGNIQLSGVNEVRAAVTNLAEIPALASAASKVLGQLPFVDTSSQAIVSTQVNTEITGALAALRAKSQILLETLAQTLPTPNQGTIYFRLPEETSLDTLNKDIKTISDAFNQMFSGQSDSLTVKLKGFDVGTEWLVLEIAPAAKVALFMTTMNGALFIARKFADYQKQLQELEDRNRDSETKNKFRDVVDTLMEGFAKDEAKRIVEKFQKNPEDPKVTEDINRLANALNSLAGVFSRGGTVQIPIEAKSSAKEESETLEQETKLLNAVMKPLLEHKK